MDYIKFIEDEIKHYKESPLKDMPSDEMNKVVNIQNLRVLDEIRDELEEIKWMFQELLRKADEKK